MLIYGMLIKSQKHITQDIFLNFEQNGFLMCTKYVVLTTLFSSPVNK